MASPRAKRIRCDGPGLRRLRRGRGFAYVRDDGRPVRDRATLARILALAIPPAWEDVWICPDARGHIQATGRDARGRKQYRYHEAWRAGRDRRKYARMRRFARALPRIRARVDADLRRRGLPREKVLAAMAAVLDESGVRPGHPEYARENRSYGLATLRKDHVAIRGAAIRLRFRGKGGREHEVDLRDARLARTLRAVAKLPGPLLFQHADGGKAVALTAGDLNRYLREAAGARFTAKDFRTWAGTVVAATELARHGAPASRAQAKRRVARAIRAVADELGNTPTVAREAYVHPAVLDAYHEGNLRRDFVRKAARAPAESPLDAAEHAVHGLLRDRGEA